MPGHFEIFTDHHFQLRYRLIAAGGEILLESGPYAEKRAIAAAIADVRECVEHGLIEDRSANARSTTPSHHAQYPEVRYGQALGGQVMTLNKPPVTAEATSAAQPVLDLQEEDIGELLGQLVRQADAVIARRPGVECGITLRRPSGSLTSACTGALATTLVDLQNRFHEGPALGAIADSHTVVLGDLAQDGRWPRFSRTALAQGIRSAVSVPLWAEDQGNAVLSVCANRTAAFSEDEISAMERFALDAARRLRPALRIADLAETLQNLYAAIANRTPIDLAVGIVMAQNQCNQPAAVGMLRRASTSRNVKMRDLAQSIIAAVPGQDAVSVHFEP